MDKKTAVAREKAKNHFEVGFDGGKYDEKVLVVDLPTIQDPSINTQKFKEMLLMDALKKLKVTGYTLDIIFLK